METSTRSITCQMDRPTPARVPIACSHCDCVEASYWSRSLESDATVRADFSLTTTTIAPECMLQVQEQSDRETCWYFMRCQRKHPPHISLGYATQSQNTAVQCGLDPTIKISLTPIFTVQCACFQADCNPHSSHGCQCSAMLQLFLYVVQRQLTICFKSSKPIQIGLCVLMSLSIHLHGLHLDAQYGQT